MRQLPDAVPICTSGGAEGADSLLVALLSVRVLLLSAKHLILAAKQLFLAAKHAVVMLRGHFQRGLRPGSLWTVIQ